MAGVSKPLPFFGAIKMAITATVDDTLNSATSLGGKVRQRLKIVGSTGAADDTSAVNLTQIGKNAIILGGGFVISATTEAIGKPAAITVKCKYTLGNDTAYVEVIGDGI
jgi:hypothetical protein